MSLPNKKYQPFLKSLNELGFCTFQIFDDQEIASLKSLYENNFGEKKIEQLYASHNSNPVEQSLKINESIKNIVEARLQEVFPGYNYFVGHFMVKGANVEKEFPLHQDWNIVEESVYKSYQVWIPLQLTYPANGGLFVVPGSHQFFDNYRSGSYSIPVVPFQDKLKHVVTDLIVPSGNVVIYHNGLFHASHINTTAEIRVAVIVNFVEKEAPLYFFQKNIATNSTDLYSISGEILLNYLPDLEKGIVDEKIKLSKSLATCSVKNESITANDLVQKFEEKFGKTEAAQIKQLHITVSEKLENHLNQNGYAVIDLLDNATVDIFKQQYLSHFGNIDRAPGRFTTLQDTNAVVKKQMHDFIVEHVDVSLRKYFKDFIIPVSQFYTKKAFTSGDIDLHGDTSLLLNHQLEPHYAVWIPLIDVNADNGTLTVIPKSHLVHSALFASSLGGYHEKYLDWLRQFEVPLSLKAGQAVIFDNNLLHNSTANKTALDRLCFTFRITHFASQYYSFFCANLAEKNIEVSEETHDYYIADTWDGNCKFPTGTPKGVIKNSLHTVQKSELEKILDINV